MRWINSRLHYYTVAQIPLEEKPESIVQIIKNSAKKLKTETDLVSISETIPRNDIFKLKATEVNNNLKYLCVKKRYRSML